MSNTPRLPPPVTLHYGVGRVASHLRRALLTPKPVAVVTPDPASWPDDHLTVTCLGHATVLANVHGVVVLFDPALLPRVGARLGERVLGPLRVTPPALRPEDLAFVDVVVISHAHADHMDTATLAALPRKSRLIVPTRTADIVAGLGFNDVHEIALGERVDVGGATIEAIPVRHYGRRHALDPVRGRGYCGYRVEKDGSSLFFGGDTAETTFSDDVCARGVDVAIFGIGGYDPYEWNHATPEQAWEMGKALRARHFLPMHWGTFQLSDEPWTAPLERLERIAADGAMEIVARRFGETFTVPRRSA
jgi:L-ascorbate metabolism protein UlaG (beta-lactamase superfamily)